VASIHAQPLRPARLAGSYRRLVVPVGDGDDSDVAVAEACLLAGSGTVVVAVAPVEVPLELPLDVPDKSLDAGAREALALARAIGTAHGVDVRTRLVRTRSAAETIVDDAEREGADAIVLRVRRGSRLGPTVEYVLRHAGCRVLVAAS
jgi:nucleotide-binding universal stress UspA family protein